MRRITTRLAVAAGGTALALAAGTAALAAVSGTPVTSTNGTAGYGALAPSGKYFTNVQSTVTPNQYGTTVKGGVHGVQLSDAPVAGACTAAQAGEVANTASSTYAVQYGVGTIGTPANPCPVGGALAVSDRNTFAGLGTVANTDDVWVSINVGEHCKVRYGDRRHHDEKWKNRRCEGRHHGRNVITFLAQDLTTNSAVVSATVTVTSPPRFTNAAAGTQEDLAPLTPCAVIARTAADNPLSPVAFADATCQVVAHFSYATAALNGGSPVTLSSLSASEAFADATTAANSAANPAVVSPQNSLSAVDHGPSGPASFGASSSGDDFGMFTANSIG